MAPVFFFSVPERLTKRNPDILSNRSVCMNIYSSRLSLLTCTVSLYLVMYTKTVLGSLKRLDFDFLCRVGEELNHLDRVRRLEVSGIVCAEAVDIDDR
jgi:hypothetical protein